MVLLIDSINAIRDFLDTGGQVLLVIGVLIFAMWLLILERFIYFFNGFRGYKKAIKNSWLKRNERNSWNAEQIRQAMISRASMRLNANLALINVQAVRALWRRAYLKQLFQLWQAWSVRYLGYLPQRTYNAGLNVK